MRYASIDCGTNTVLLLVAEVHPGQRPRLTVVEEQATITRLGQGLDQTGQLAEPAMERTLATLTAYARRAKELGARRLVAVGTESLRAARNRKAFLRRAEEAGVRLRVVAGEDEARLSWRSVVESLPPPRPALGSSDPWRSVLDIGGGSTELIVGRHEAEQFRSVPIGSVRLTERLLHHDPPLSGEREALVQTIDAALAKLPRPQGELCALAGTATTVAALHLGLVTYDSQRVDGLRVPTEAVGELARRLGELSVAERRLLPGLDPRRADVIYAGATILHRVALQAAVDEVVVSDRGVRWGLIEELADRLDAKGPKGPEAGG